jgi:hypothetical protein
MDKKILSKASPEETGRIPAKKNEKRKIVHWPATVVGILLGGYISYCDIQALPTLDPVPAAWKLALCLSWVALYALIVYFFLERNWWLLFVPLLTAPLIWVFCDGVIMYWNERDTPVYHTTTATFISMHPEVIRHTRGGGEVYQYIITIQPGNTSEKDFRGAKTKDLVVSNAQYRKFRSQMKAMGLRENVVVEILIGNGALGLPYLIDIKPNDGL